MKVMLIYPPSEFPSQLLSSKSPGVSWSAVQVRPPLGLAYLAAVLEESGIKVQIMDCIALGWRLQKELPDQGQIRVGLSYDEILADLKRFGPDIVGINSCFTCQSHMPHKVARVVKEYDQAVPVIVGGVHATLLPEETVKDPDVDYVAIGEGEETLLELVHTLDAGRPVDEVAGIAWKKGNQIVFNQRRELIKDLDSLPFPARHLLPMEEYSKCLEESMPHDLTVRPRPRGLMLRLPWANIVSSRGCPYNCVFCVVNVLSNRRWRPRSAENVVDEIEHLVEKFGTKTIQFEDDNFSLDMKRVERICNELQKRRLDIDWECFGIAIRHTEKGLLQKMRKAGCTKISFGIESGNQRILSEVIHKPLKLDEARNAIRWASEAGIITRGYFVIGLPGETKETIRDTINFAKNSGLDTADFLPPMPYPGTQLYKVLKENDQLKSEDWVDYWVPNIILETNELTEEDIRKWIARAQVEFKGTPAYAVYRFQKVRSVPELLHLIDQGIKVLGARARMILETVSG